MSANPNGPAPAPDSDGAEGFTDPRDGTPEEQLQRYHAAIRSEFETASNRDATTVELERTIRDFFKKSAPSCAAEIVWLANNAQSEGIRFSAAKYVVQEGLAAVKADGETPMEKLLRELHNQPTTAGAVDKLPK